jgi:hypothetical protein
MKKTGITIAAILMVLALFAGCADIFSPPPAADGDGPAPGTGRALVSVGPQGARTFMPADYSAYGGLSYTYEFTAEGMDPVSGTITDGTESVDLEPGTWDLTVQGFNYGTPVMEGKVTDIEINSGQQTAVSVSMAGIPGGADGSLEYTVNFPDTVSSGFLRVYPWNKEALETQVDLLNGTPNNDGTITSTGVLSLAPGCYRVALDLAIPGTPGGVFNRTEIAHIYPGLTTPAEFTIQDTDFIPATGQSDLAAALAAISGLSSGDNVVYFLSSASESMAEPVAAIENSNGPVIVTIDGGGREVALTGSYIVVGNNVTLAFRNITLRGHQGAGVSLVRVKSGGTLELGTGARITGNRVSSYSSIYGGGVYVAGYGTFIMNGGEITGNTVYSASPYPTSPYSSYGGGVYVDSDGIFIMNGGEITGNTVSNYCTVSSSATSTSSSYGGGVCVGVSGTFTMNGGEITGNTAFNSSSTTSYYDSNSRGGGVCVIGNGIFTMNGGEITENTASNSSTTTFASFSSSSYGGGVCMDGAGAFTMNGGKITGNTASSSLSSSYGGGLYAGTFATFTMSGGEIMENTASSGGGLYVTGTFTMSGGEITGNTATSTSYSSYSSTYSSGGGVYVALSGTFIMSGGGITGNTATSIPSSFFSSSYGGGVYVAGTFTMDGGGITVNTLSSSSSSSDSSSSYSSSSYGGGVYVARDGIFTMSGGEITGNTATSTSASRSSSTSSGGGVYVAGDGIFTMSRGGITGNTATSTSASRSSTSSGGGVYVAGDGIFTMSEGEITGNTVSSESSYSYSYGGGVYVNKGGLFTMSGGEITGNTASSSYYSSGGGVYMSGNFTMSGGEITGNTAFSEFFSSGGEVYVNGTFKMSGDARPERVFLYHSFITISGPLNITGIPIDLQIESSLTKYVNTPILTLDSTTYPSGNMASLKERFTLGNSKLLETPFTETPITGYRIDDNGLFVAE